MHLSSSGKRFFAACVLLAAAACGGSVSVDPIVGAGAPSGGPGAGGGSGGSGGLDPTLPVEPALPTGPYSGAVGTTDVSILYPIREQDNVSDFVRPDESGLFGPLVPSAMLDVVLGVGGSLEKVQTQPPSKASELRLVGVRLDPCSARGGAGCRSEVRAVFQALHQLPPGADEITGPTALDGGIHVAYDIPDVELVTLMKEILTLKKANGDLATHELGPHPILKAQGVGGAFATGLRTVWLHHLGAARVGRITAFDHNMEPDEDGWRFAIFERTGDTLTAGKIPMLKDAQMLVSGSNATRPLVDSHANPGFFDVVPADSVAALVGTGRPAKGTPQASGMPAVFAAALRVQNPSVHSPESIDCANCHLAEGARRIGEAVYGLKASSFPAFQSARSLAYVTEGTSVSNLHAFGYLGRKVSIMQRTANESVVVADLMEAKVK